MSVYTCRFSSSGTGSFLTIGSIRYGVRLGAVSPPPPGAHYRASVGLLHQQQQRLNGGAHTRTHNYLEECFCGRGSASNCGCDCDCHCHCECDVVSSPRSRSLPVAASLSQIPLLADEQQPPINSYGIFSPVNSVDVANSSTGCTSLQSELERRNEHETAVCRTHSLRVGNSGCWTATPTVNTNNKVQVTASAAASGSACACAGAGAGASSNAGSSGSVSASSAQLFLQNQLRRKVIVRSQSACDATTAFVKLYQRDPSSVTNAGLQYADISSLLAKEREREQIRHVTLDRLNKFRFGGNRATNKEHDTTTNALYSRGKKISSGRSSDEKAERLRELTDRWKRASQKFQSDGTSQAYGPVPPPRNRHSGNYQQHLQLAQKQKHPVQPHVPQMSDKCVSQIHHAVAASATPVPSPPETASTTVELAGSPPPALPPSPPPAPPPAPPPLSHHLLSVADEFARVKSDVPALNSVDTLFSFPAVPSARAAPVRSMSFSQVEYSPSDGKYIRRRKSDATDLTGTASSTIPRKKNNQTIIKKNDEKFVEKNNNCSTQVKKVDYINPDNEIKQLFERNSSLSALAISSGEASDITLGHPEKVVPAENVTVLDGTDNGSAETSASCADKKRDRSRRRKGMYISQWPGQREPLVLECNPAEDPGPEPSSTDEPHEDYCHISLSTKTAAEHDNSNNENKKKLLESSVRNIVNRDQSCEDADIYADYQSKIHRFSRTDSFSEGESEHSERRPLTPNRDNINCLLSPSDLSDNEIRPSVVSSPRAPRRYSKRPLRGPYGQMLEAEMKKPDLNKIFTKHHQRNDLKFLDEFYSNNCQRSLSPSKGAGSMVSLTSSTSVGSADLKKHVAHNRDSSNNSLDETQLKNNLNISQLSRQSSAMNSPARKINVEVSSSAPTSVHNESEPENQRLFSHQRTTSSPSKLEVIAMPTGASGSPQAERATSVTPSSELLQELLRGSSERLTLTSLSDSNSPIGTGAIMQDVSSNIIYWML